MRLGMLMLADNAAAAEGKLYIHGGGISRITPPRLPWAHPMLTLMLRLDADDVDDLDAAHQIVVAIVDPDGAFIVGPGDLTVERPTPQLLLEGEPLVAYLAVTVAPVTFERAGLHEVQVDVDGASAIRLPLPVAVINTGISQG